MSLKGEDTSMDLIEDGGIYNHMTNQGVKNNVNPWLTLEEQGRLALASKSSSLEPIETIKAKKMDEIRRMKCREISETFGGENTGDIRSEILRLLREQGTRINTGTLFKFLEMSGTNLPEGVMSNNFNAYVFENLMGRYRTEDDIDNFYYNFKNANVIDANGYPSMEDAELEFEVNFLMNILYAFYECNPDDFVGGKRRRSRKKRKLRRKSKKSRKTRKSYKRRSQKIRR